MFLDSEYVICILLPVIEYCQTKTIKQIETFFHVVNNKDFYMCINDYKNLHLQVYLVFVLFLYLQLSINEFTWPHVTIHLE